MKAIRKCDYGVLTLREVEKPSPADNQVLIKVRAASLNAADGHLLRGFLAMRPLTGMRKPKDTRFGIDCAGTVEAVGKNVTEFKAGDEVFGVANGSIAEYACTSERTLVTRPENVSFEQAGSVGVAGLTALQGLRNQGNVHAGQRVLINGASGGVGTFAVQIAKALGAEVTAVCSSRNLEQARSIGADHVIDYTKEDFTKGDQHYDVIFDNVGNHTIAERRRVLTPNGVCVLAGMGSAGKHEGQWARIGGNLKAFIVSPFIPQKFKGFIAKTLKADLAVLRDLMREGKLTPVIDREYPMSETAEALRYLEEGHARAKIVITISGDAP
ncbi:MAG TPA: NAD(P)-dependent alcohol dehydrogenase [Verrucomicrobiae bacterium]|nr:NAD(P)-dependent alcohol dehydrogenase [Verrucomicrobiae bacterium]